MTVVAAEPNTGWRKNSVRKKKEGRGVKQKETTENKGPFGSIPYSSLQAPSFRTFLGPSLFWFQEYKGCLAPTPIGMDTAPGHFRLLPHLFPPN